jgi:predicted neutral ceramidase superfamily lipid hydrolase
MNRSGHTHLVRVEIRIEYDDRICGIQVDSDAARSSTEHVDENIRVRFVKLVHALLAIGLFGVSVLEKVKTPFAFNTGVDNYQAQVLVAFTSNEVLDNIKCHNKLWNIGHQDKLPKCSTHLTKQ